VGGKQANVRSPVFLTNQNLRKEGNVPNIKAGFISLDVRGVDRTNQ
jgi:hypothetical protein